MPNQSPAQKKESAPLFKDSRAWVIGAFVVGMAFGPGVIWNWKASELSTAVSTTELRNAQSRILQKVIALSAEYIAAEAVYLKPRTPDEQVQAYTKMKALQQQLGLEKSNFLALETKLATLERRDPDAIPLEFVLPAPSPT